MLIGFESRLSTPESTVLPVSIPKQQNRTTLTSCLVTTYQLCFTGKLSQPYVVPYASAKFALDGFFLSLRQEFFIDDTDVSITICYIGGTGY